MTSVSSVKTSWLVSRDAPLNDNSAPSSLCRERLQAESVLSRSDYIRPRQSLSTGLIIICAMCLMIVAAFTLLGLEF